MTRALLLVAATAAAAIALLFARPHPTPGPPMRDFEAYYAGGAVWNEKGDPYSQAVWSAEQNLDGVTARYEALPFVDPPAALPLFGLLARLPFNTANVVWRALLIAALASYALLTLGAARKRIDAFSVLAIALVALGFGPLMSALALGQLALPAGLFALLAISRPEAGFFAWLQPNIGIALSSQLCTKRGALFAVLFAALFAGACIAVYGAGGVLHYANVLHAQQRAEAFSAIQMTPAAVAYGFGASTKLAQAIGTAVALAVACVWVIVMRRAPDGFTRFCATCALAPLAMPFSHEHSLLIAFVPAVVYAIKAPNSVRPVALLGALVLATDWLGLAQRPDGTLQTMLLTAACGGGLVALQRRLLARTLLVPLGVVAAIAVAAFFAHGAPAPVWPDAMGGLPRDIASLRITQAWHAEQVATGLFSRNTCWAALRAFSLLGCALTATAIAASLRSPARSRIPSPAPA